MTECAGAVVAVDVGGTTIKGALVDTAGHPLARLEVPTPAAEGGAAVTRAVLRVAAEPAAGHGGSDGPPPLLAAAAVTPGRVDSAAGVVRYATNLGWRADVPLAGLLAAELGVPAVIDHDARAAGLAEAVLGAEPTRDCLFVALGTGIGAALVADGRVRPGAAWTAGEVGHAPVYPGGDPCPCGQRGCLEAYASAAAIGRRYAAATGLGTATALDVVARLGRDEAADAVWALAVDALATSLVTCVLLLDPGTVVLGGGLACAGNALLDPVRERLAAALTWRTPPPVVASTLGADAGWRGAALLALEAVGVKL